MIKRYLNSRKSTVYLYFCYLITFPLICILFRYSFVSVAYSLLIVTFLLLLYAAADYTKFLSKMKYLKDTNKHLTADKLKLARAENAVEEQYLQMVNSLYDKVLDQLESMDKSHTEQVEYYTMWVHQIKTPISAMRLALQSGRQVSLSLLEQELFKIEQYVELALSYTRMKDLSNDLVIREYDLEEIVNQSIKKYAPLFIYKRLSVNVEEFHETVATDSKWLAFILEQLLSNAVKYTNQGGITITYSDKTLRITDTGIGIRLEDIDRVFEKGYTGYNGRIDKKASGIGLYLAKKAADALSVKINVTSKVGEGTAVSVAFPEYVTQM